MRTLHAVVVAGLVALPAHASLFDVNFVGGFLSGLNEVPPTFSTALGAEVGPGISYDNVSKALTLNVAYGAPSFPPLLAPYTASHLHTAPLGVNGPVAINLAGLHVPLTTTSGSYSGSVFLDPAQEAALLGGGLYMNIHSQLFPGGEIRAQLVVNDPAIPEPSTWIALGGLAAPILLTLRRRGRASL